MTIRDSELISLAKKMRAARKRGDHNSADRWRHVRAKYKNERDVQQYNRPNLSTDNMTPEPLSDSANQVSHSLIVTQDTHESTCILSNISLEHALTRMRQQIYESEEKRKQLAFENEEKRKQTSFENDEKRKKKAFHNDDRMKQELHALQKNGDTS